MKAVVNYILDNRYGLSVFFLAAIFLLPFLGMFPLIDPDEPVYGQTAREMLAAGDWLSPRIYGNFWYDKPPLFYWLEMISYSLFGISDYTSRLPSAIMGLATIGTVYIQCRAIFNKHIAFRAAVVLLTSLGFIYIGKAAVTDMTLVFTLTFTMLAFYRKQYYTAYAGCGLALLAKGPVGYAFPAIIMLLYIIFTRRWTLLKEMKIPRGILLAFLIGLPWYIAMYAVHGAAFTDAFIGYHNFTRFAAPEHPGQNSIFFFVPIVLGAMMPWTGALFQAMYRIIRGNGPYHDGLLFCLIWAVFIFVFFSFSKTQLVTYIAPLFPPLSIILGWYTYALKRIGRLPRIWLVSSYIGGLILLACNAIPLNENALFFSTPILWASLLLTAALVLPAICMQLKNWRAALICTVLSMFAFMTIAFAGVLPQAQEYISGKTIAADYVSLETGNTTVYIEKFLCPALAFYGNITGTAWEINEAPDFKKIRTIPQKAYFIMQRSTYNKLLQTQPDLNYWQIVRTTPGQLILVNTKEPL